MPTNTHAQDDSTASAPATTENDVTALETDADGPANWIQEAVAITQEHYEAHGTPPTRSEIARQVAPTQSTGNARLRGAGISSRGICTRAGVPWRTDIVAELVHDYLDHLGTNRSTVTTRRLDRESERYGGREIGEGLRTLCENKDDCADREAVGALVIERGETNHSKWVADRRETPKRTAASGGGL